MKGFLGQSVRHSIGWSWFIQNPVLESQQFGEVLLLPYSMQPLPHQLHQALLVCEDGEFSKLKILTPLLHYHDHCKVLLLICAKATRTGTQGLADECQRMPVLSEHRTNSGSTSIGLNTEWFGEIGKCQHRGRAESLLQGLEGLVMYNSPLEKSILPQ